MRSKRESYRVRQPNQSTSTLTHIPDPDTIDSSVTLHQFAPASSDHDGRPPVNQKKNQKTSIHLPVHMAFQWLVYEPWDGVGVVVLRLMSASEISALS
jgi:hypothetical protein